MQKNVCPNCGMAAMAGTIYCDQCGFDLRVQQPDIPTTTSGEIGRSISAPQNACFNCSFINVDDAVFCENCGVSLGPKSAPVLSTSDFQHDDNALLPGFEIPEALSPDQHQSGGSSGTPMPVVEGRLVNQARGMDISLNLDKPELIVGREDEASGVFPEVNLEPYGAQDDGVSRMHLRISVQEGKIVIEDLNTVNGTILNHQRLTAGQPAQLNHGDEIRLGKMVLYYYT